MPLTSALAGIAEEARIERISYPLSYGPKDVERQLDIIAERWPKIDTSQARALAKRIGKRPKSPDWLEAAFCVIDPNFFGEYTDAVEAVLDGLIVARKGNRTSVVDRLRSVHLQGRSLRSCLQQSKRTREFHDALRKSQPGHVWIVYGQFGWHHRSRCVSEVRASYEEREYGFGLLEAGCMLLTHRRRFVNSAVLQIECPGDEFQSRGSDHYQNVPFLHVYDGNLSIDVSHESVPTNRAGSLTGVLPNFQDLVKRPSP